MGTRFVKRPRQVALTHGKVMWVNAEDYDGMVVGPQWRARKDKNAWYAVRTITLDSGKRTTQFAHQFITGLDGVDHKDGNGLNNLRFNLRPATSAQQA